MTEPSLEHIEVDIVISTYRRGASIDTTIASIRADKHQHFTLWVLDQSDNDLTQQCVEKHVAEDPRVRYLRVPLRGLCATRNAGAKLGTASYILFTNDDIRVAEDWIEPLVESLIAKNASAAFGRVLPEPHPSDHTEGVVLGLKASMSHELYEKEYYNLGFGHGHNMAVAREAFEQLGGFDELLGAGAPLGAWDERDFGYRVLRHGGRIVYTPDAVAYHRHLLDWKGVNASYRGYGLGAGAAVGKYLRLGDLGALTLLGEWMMGQGLRQVVSGVVKWHSAGKVKAGLTQFYYPLVGIARGLRYNVDRSRGVYIPPSR